jgi:hypothetical protein
MKVPILPSNMHPVAESLAGVVLITVPTIGFGGARLLTMIFRREPGCFPLSA